MAEEKDLCSSPPVRTLKLQLAIEQPLIGGYWNPPKKDIPCPKTKKQLQWDSRSGAITIKLNPIPTGWVSHKLKNRNIKEVLPLLWTFWTPCQASEPGDPTKEQRIPRESGLEGERDLMMAFQRTEGNRDSSLGVHKQNFVHTKKRGAEIPQETDSKLPASVGGPPVEVWVSSGPPQGQGH